MARRVVLAVDVGGSHVKALTSNRKERRRFVSGRSLTPEEMVAGTLAAAAGWTWSRVAVGIPAPVRGGKVVSEPANLGTGWVGFDFESAFGKPTRVVNDAVMQAIGSYRGGRMLFLGLGTGLGSTMIADGVVEPLELAHLPYRKKTFEDYLGERSLEKRGKKKWTKDVFAAVAHLRAAMEPDEIVLGGGGVTELDELPDGCRRGENANAFVGGFRLWDSDWLSHLTS
jgi:predicted NBD/HSP70 family sugar kinase